MRYQNTKTGFVFESKSKVSAEGWVLLDSQPEIVDKNEEPAKTKKTTTKRKK